MEFCTKHNIALKEFKSKTKFAEDGTPRTYMGHFVQGEGMCFGDSKPKSDTKSSSDPSPQIQKLVAESQEVWNAKDRQSMAQTAMKSASEIVAAMLSAKYAIPMDEIESEVKTMANEFYKELKQMKNTSEDLDNWPG